MFNGSILARGWNWLSEGGLAGWLALSALTCVCCWLRALADGGVGVDWLQQGDECRHADAIVR